jgi:hypothetical protein
MSRGRFGTLEAQREPIRIRSGTALRRARPYRGENSGPGKVNVHEPITTAVALSSEKRGLNLTIYGKIVL